jgi:hypothetical protein
VTVRRRDLAGSPAAGAARRPAPGGERRERPPASEARPTGGTMSGMIRRQDHPSKRRWKAAEIRLLGQVADTEIARKLGIAPSTVAAERRRRGIPPRRGPYAWTAEALRLLGRDSDERVAAMLGVSISLVGSKRRDLGIPACHSGHGSARSRPDPFWTPARDALVGTASDAVIARRLGVTLARVRGRRYRLGVPPACPIPRYDWTRMDPLLARESDAALAARFGVHEETVRRRRLKLGIPPYQPERRTIRRDRALRRLLVRPTVEIGEVSSSSVATLRRALGVAPPPRRSRWTAGHLRRLGKVPDDDLARELGISRAAVRQKRYAVGIRLRPWRPWTAAERALLAEIHDDREAARRLGRSVKAIRHLRARR